MFKDPRFIHFRLTIFFLTLFVLVYLMSLLMRESYLFDFSNASGLQEVLSFNTSSPWRYAGSTVFSSFFIHFNLAHLAQDVVFFGWFGFVTEKILKAKKMLLLIFGCQFITLLLLGLFIKGDHNFLGSSLGAISLFVFYCIVNKKYFLYLAAVIALTVVPLVTNNNLYSMYAHTITILLSSFFCFIGQKRLWFK